MLPALDTSRLLIRERTLADVESCLEMDRDPEVTRYISGPWRDPAAHRQFVEYRTTRRYPPGLGYWTLRERSAPNAFLGWVLLIPDHGTGPDVEIGWRLVRSAWGRGIASEAAWALVAHAFDNVQLPRVIADIAAENQASLRVARKLGMKWVGYDASDGRRYERYRLERSDFLAG
ncbi:MAG TPA: GNAT family N-acetyltransferase [Trinickia sp.]